MDDLWTYDDSNFNNRNNIIKIKNVMIEMVLKCAGGEFGECREDGNCDLCQYNTESPNYKKREVDK